ncbi:MAG TPA: hypothetical protein VM677_17990, partial [Actinokineospora sp.]|nr:hypothetical protein [Actinokineospora sp.]
LGRVAGLAGLRWAGVAGPAGMPARRWAGVTGLTGAWLVGRAALTERTAVARGTWTARLPGRTGLAWLAGLPRRTRVTGLTGLPKGTRLPRRTFVAGLAWLSEWTVLPGLTELPRRAGPAGRRMRCATRVRGARLVSGSAAPSRCVWWLLRPGSGGPAGPLSLGPRRARRLLRAGADVRWPARPWLALRPTRVRPGRWRSARLGVRRASLRRPLLISRMLPTRPKRRRGLGRFPSSAARPGLAGSALVCRGVGSLGRLVVAGDRPVGGLPVVRGVAGGSPLCHLRQSRYFSVGGAAWPTALISHFS